VKVTVKRARLTWEVFQRAYERAELPSTRNAAALALVSGQSREVVAAAMFSQVGTVERPGAQPVECWKVTRGKTGAMIAIPLELRLNVFGLSLRDVIKQCRATGVASRYMVHNSTRRKGSRMGDPVPVDRITKDFTAAIEALGIDWAGAEPPTFHEIRSLSKRLYKAQGNVDTKDLLGHKTEQMSDLYADARGAEYVLVSIG
jgi:integrase